MDKKDLLLFITVLMLASLAKEKYFPSARSYRQEVSESPPVGGSEALTNHTLEFEKKIYKVTEGVYSAVGYGLANSILLEGPDGITIVDTLENNFAAAEVYADFRKITTKPVKAIIYTHFHADHNGGTAAFVNDSTSPYEIYSHSTTMSELTAFVGVANEMNYKRAMRQFGSLLDESDHINCGIGPKLHVGRGQPIGFLPPTKTFQSRMEIEAGGLEMTLIHAPGETNDQLVVWIPSKKVLCAADNIYKSFPNIYAIRGTRTRDVVQWVRSLDVMRGLKPDHLVPSHTQPISGADLISSLLLTYRDGMQFVYDQTIRHLNKGLTPDEIVPLVQLPPSLESHPFLQPFYGTVPWSVRAIFDGELGWFSGRSKDLNPLSPTDKARNLIDLAGGPQNLASKAKDACQQDKYQWCLELVESLLTLQDELQPSTLDEMKKLKGTALRALAVRQPGATGRNYYLTEAEELDGLSLAMHDKDFRDTIMHPDFDLKIIFRSMATRLDPKKSRDINKTVFFHLSAKDFYLLASVHIRRGVCDVKFNSEALAFEKPDLEVRTSVQVWKELVVGDRSAFAALATRELVVEGHGLVPSFFFSQIIDLFDKPPPRRSE